MDKIYEGILQKAWTTAWNTIKQPIKQVGQYYKDVGNFYKNYPKRVSNAYKSYFNTINNITSDNFKAATNIFKNKDKQQGQEDEKIEDIKNAAEDVASKSNSELFDKAMSQKDQSLNSSNL